jgi:alkylation response protein AidB-like acyl-CoA dehydrogenase
MDTPGVRIVRELPVFGHYDGHGGHPEVEFSDVRVPASNLLAGEGDGFMIAQARLGPGRIHHCMRLIGMAERGFDLMCERALVREPFGKPIADQGLFHHWVAQARVRIEQARLLTLKTAHLMDTVGNKGARMEIAAIKIVAPEMATWVLDRAIQTFGGAGVSDDTPLAMMWSHARTLRLADGPDAWFAAEVLAQIDALSPDDARGYYEVAEQLAAMRQYPRSEAMYQVAIERAPWWTQPRNGLGLLYTQSGDDEAALLTRAPSCCNFHLPMCLHLAHPFPPRC